MLLLMFIPYNYFCSFMNNSNLENNVIGAIIYLFRLYELGPLVKRDTDISYVVQCYQKKYTR